uniref:Uncharacterized protein n=1 Tax=Tetranychus urticae TaxID=32264 RepID=T1JXH3_TETUR
MENSMPRAPTRSQVYKSMETHVFNQITVACFSQSEYGFVSAGIIINQEPHSRLNGVKCEDEIFRQGDE